MADGIEVRVRGAAELAADTAKLATNIDRGAGLAFLGVAEDAASRTRSSLHVDTGATVGSVISARTSEGAMVSMGDGVPYATYEEYGGRGWPHSPTGNFLYPAAVENSEPLLVAAGERAAEREIGAMTWSTP